MKKAYFQYWESFEVIVQKIKDPEVQNHCRMAIINYGLHGIEPGEMGELEDMAFTIVREMIDQQQHRRQVNSDNRAKKSEPAEDAVVKESLTTEPEEPKKTTRMQKPTQEEIAAYIQEKGYMVDAATFWNYYEATGWKIGGKAAMKDWRAAVKNWNARDKHGGGTIYQRQDNTADAYQDVF